MDNVTLQIAFLVVLIMLSAYFSATETAFSSLNRIKLKNMAHSGNNRASKTLELCKKYDKLLSTILIGNNIVNILSTSVATALFVIYFPRNGVALSTIVMTIVVLTFGEITPKSIAKEMPESFAMFSTPLISLLLKLLAPLNYLFALLKTLVKKMFKIKVDHSVSDREILTLIHEAKKDGSINEDEGRLLINSIEFYEMEVSDILTPRVDVIAIDIEDSREEIEHKFKSSGFSRLPVYKETIDNIIGIINEKDFYYTDNFKSIIYPAVFVLEEMKISKLLTILKRKKSHLAIVTDEYGGTVGVASLEDVLEELVGEIWDEHDLVREEFCKLSQNRYKVSGGANIDKLLEIFGLEKSEESESTTVSGWIMEMLGHIPASGETFQYNNLTFVVTKLDQNRIAQVMVTKPTPSQIAGS